MLSFCLSIFFRHRAKFEFSYSRCVSFFHRKEFRRKGGIEIESLIPVSRGAIIFTFVAIHCLILKAIKFVVTRIVFILAFWLIKVVFDMIYNSM